MYVYKIYIHIISVYVKQIILKSVQYGRLKCFDVRL